MMKTVQIIEEKGSFSFIDFCISHNQILYRHHNIESKTNTDILFSGVRYIELPMQITDCLIRKGDATDVQQAKQKFDYPNHSKTFVVEQEGYRHFVVADNILIQSNGFDFLHSSIPIKLETPRSTDEILFLVNNMKELQEERGLDWVLENEIHNAGDWRVLE